MFNSRKKLNLICIIIICFLYSFTVSHAYIDGSDLKVGDFIQFGKYNGESILWRVLEVDDSKVMLISDKIITLKAFDASYRIGYCNCGYNRWNESNIRDWLNSISIPKLKDETWGNENEWTHIKPTTIQYNNYINNPGFLSNFKIYERDMILKIDNQGIVTSNGDKVMLIKKEQLPLLLSAGYSIIRQ